ncbi:hypothetical protein WJT86_06355 [Microvirga sp. W0021]|uniref:Lipoprotein n=1 Tax=Hohaiivirga grylli TaxID=3133970 RepID=A0ABV0BK65_9HYPH
MKKRMMIILSGILLAGCVQNTGRVIAVDTPPPGPALKELRKIVDASSYGQFERCFKRNSTYTDDITLFKVVYSKSKNKLCAIAVSRKFGVAGAGPMSATFDMSDVECSLQAVSCLNPAAAKRIAAKYNLKIIRYPTDGE